MNFDFFEKTLVEDRKAFSLGKLVNKNTLIPFKKLWLSGEYT